MANARRSMPAPNPDARRADRHIYSYEKAQPIQEGEPSTGCRDPISLSPDLTRIVRQSEARIQALATLT